MGGVVQEEVPRRLKLNVVGLLEALRGYQLSSTLPCPPFTCEAASAAERGGLLGMGCGCLLPSSCTAVR